MIRACHELDIKAVAVYSDADKRAMHVREADEAYHIGPAPAAESYLVQSRLIEIALKSGCDAIHPGYGFLAENATFAQLVIDSGLTYIGSTPESIRLLGDKVESRRAMLGAGIPMTSGTEGVTEDLTTEVVAKLAKEAERITYPVLVKAAGGGGGKGMRIVRKPEELTGALEGARREAASAFSNPMIYIEKFIEEPRHVEFQVFGDKFGHYIHLFERECSIQRRHQKIIEESPSPALDADLRHRMGEAAVAVARTANYQNAGTVEFLLDKNRNFYFLEVNTRIQVEHPVTEMVTGVDLVKEQILVAAGRELSWSQSDLVQRGHAIEARIYAEDGANNFLPSPGPVHFLRAPMGPGVRWDGGVESGDEVSVYYDPIIAKLICFGENRGAALGRLDNALRESVVFGLTTNIEFLKAVASHPQFRCGEVDTNFIPQYLSNWQPDEVSDADLVLVHMLAYQSQRKAIAQSDSQEVGIPDPWVTTGPWQIASGSGQ